MCSSAPRTLARSGHDPRGVIVHGLVHHVLTEAGIDGGRAQVRVVQHLADQMQVVTGLGQPGADRAPQIVQPQIGNTGSVSDPEPWIVDID